MYLSVRDCMVAGATFSTPADGLRHLGVNHVEIELNGEFRVMDMETPHHVYLDTDDAVAGYRRQLDDLGLHACCLLTYEDALDRSDYVEWMVRAVHIADQLGAPCLRVDPVMKRGAELTFQERVDAQVKPLREVVRRTGKSDVTFGLENHGVFGNSLAFLLNVFDDVQSDRVGMTLDTGNFYWRGNPRSEVYGILRVLAPYAKHTHVKNINYPPEKHEVDREAGWEYDRYCSPLDEGDIDHRRVAEILKAAGYEGDLCIEDESLEKYEAGAARRAVLERDVQHVRDILANL